MHQLTVSLFLSQWICPSFPLLFNVKNTASLRAKERARLHIFTCDLPCESGRKSTVGEKQWEKQKLRAGDENKRKAGGEGWDGERGEVMEAPAASSPAQLKQREIYEASVERKCCCYRPLFSAPSTELFPLTSPSSARPFFALNLDHPDGGAARRGSGRRPFRLLGGHVRAAGRQNREEAKCCCWVWLGFYFKASPSES